MTIYSSKEEVHNRGCEAVGKTLYELSQNMPEKKTSRKSYAGDAWESWFGIYKNSTPKPDLPEAGVDLKAKAVITNRNGKTAKERLVLNLINYIEEYDKSFDTSSFCHKNQYIELGFYDYDENIDYKSWELVKAVLFTYPYKDLLIIKNDWELIHSYIVNGRAHELTEGLTIYLCACQKGVINSKLILRQSVYSRI